MVAAEYHYCRPLELLQAGEQRSKLGIQIFTTAYLAFPTFFIELPFNGIVLPRAPSHGMRHTLVNRKYVWLMRLTEVEKGKERAI